MKASLMVVAGEVSGDMHAAGLLRELQQIDPGRPLWGIGGDEMKACGVELLHQLDEMAVMGVSEVVRKYPFFRRVFRELLDEIDRRRPEAVLLVDYPDFNLPLAQAAKARGCKVLYYVCPQVWAWRRSRIERMARTVDRLLVIFPFEREEFAGTGLQVDYVGHPLVDEAAAVRSAPPAALPWPGEPRVALLPGSRVHEIERILPPLLQAAALMEKRHPGIGFLAAAPSGEIAALVRRSAAALPDGPQRFAVVAGSTRQILRQARAAIVASGTATIEAALQETPMLVVYRTAWSTYALGRLFVRVPSIGMVNLVAGRRICPEFVQGAVRPGALAAALDPLLADTPAYRDMKSALHEVAHDRLEGGAARRAARIVADALSAADSG